MKPQNALLMLLFSFSHGVLLGAAATTSGGRDLYIEFCAPPFSAYLSDSSGLRDGIDPNTTLSANGQQLVNGNEYELKEIPDTMVDQNNLDEGQSSTAWEISLSAPSGTYVLNYSSMLPQSIETVQIDLLGPLAIYDETLLAQKGFYKQLQIVVSPAGLTTTPLINSGDFLRDTQSACSLGEISPTEACEALEDLAAEVEKSISGGDARKEATELNLYLFVLNLLHNWGSSGSLQNWQNLAGCPECVPLFKKGTHGVNFFAKDPAYSALVLDAQTLLNALPNQGTSQGGGNQDGSDQGGGNHGGGNEGGGNQGESNHRRGDN